VPLTGQFTTMKYVVIACGILSAIFLGVIANNFAATASPETTAAVTTAWKTMTDLIGLGDPREDPIVGMLERYEKQDHVVSLAATALAFGNHCEKLHPAILKAFRSYAKLHPQVQTRIELFRLYEQNSIMKALLLMEQNAECEHFAAITKVARANGWLG
jgi:hypothetical protein